MKSSFAPLLAALILAAPAGAEASEDVALHASQVHEDRCRTVAGGSAIAAGRALGDVSEAWVAVSEAFAEDPRAYLLYWRGVLAQCLSQETKAEADLDRFVRWYSEAGARARSTYSSLDEDARRRLRRLGARGPGPGGVPAAAVGGVAATAGAGAMAGIAAWQAAERDAAWAAYVAPGPKKDFDGLLEQAEVSQAAAAGLGIGAAAAGGDEAHVHRLARVGRARREGEPRWVSRTTATP